jgi:hypothetical protein
MSSSFFASKLQEAAWISFPRAVDTAMLEG